MSRHDRRRPSTHPDSIELDLERIAEDFPRIAAEYREAFRYGFDRRDRKGNHLDQTEGDHARGQDPERQAKVTVKGLPGNPTLTVMVEQEWVRREVKAVGRLFDDLGKLVSTIDGRLGRIFHDPEDEDYEPTKRQPILGEAEKRLQRQGEAMKRKRDLQEEEKRLMQALIRVRREMKETA